MLNQTVFDNPQIAERIQIRTVENIHIIETKNIIRCEACKNYTIIYVLNEKCILVSHTLKNFETILSYPFFLRVHQSHLINTGFIKCIEKQNSKVLLLDNSTIPYSVRKFHLLLDYLKSLPGV
jgi:two-component system, LytTR family, response regulator